MFGKYDVYTFVQSVYYPQQALLFTARLVLILRKPVKTSVKATFILFPEHQQKEACGNGGADNARNIGAHSMHKEEVRGVIFSALNL